MRQLPTDSENITTSKVAQVFISYGRSDAIAFAKRLASDLENHGGYRVFLDSKSIEKGGLWEVRIEQGIKQSKVLLAVLSQHALREDSVCRDEVVYALCEGKQVVPVRQEANPQIRLPLLLARRNWIDFSVGYEEGFQTLLRFLNGDTSALRQPVLPTVTGVVPLDFGPEIARFTFGFVGRQWLSDKIDLWLVAPNRRALVIIGEPGVGKSAVAAWLTQVRRSQVAAIYFCTHRNTRTLNPFEFVACIVGQLCSQVEGFENAVVERQPEARRQTASDAFRELVVEPARLVAQQEHPSLIIVDSLDEAARQSGETVVSVLARHAEDLPNWVRVVATTRPEETVLRQIRVMSTFELTTNSSANVDDVKLYIYRRLCSSGLAERNSVSADALADRLTRLAEGNFLYACKTLEAMEDNTLTINDLGHLTNSLSGFYSSLFDKMFPDIDVYLKDYHAILKVLALARGPVPFRMLHRALAQTPEVVNRRLLVLKTCLRYHGSSEAFDYTLYHQSLRDWLIDRDASGVYWCDGQSSQALLADLCWAEYQMGTEAMSPYAKHYMAYHLAEAHNWAKLRSAIEDPSLALVANWVEDFTSIEGSHCLAKLVTDDLSDSVFTSGIATQLARIETRRGNYSKAQKYLTDAVAGAQGPEGRRVRAVAFHELANLDFYQGRVNDAGELYKRALHCCRRAGVDFAGEAAANYIGLATLAAHDYKWLKCLRLARKAHSLSSACGDQQHVVAARRMIAMSLTERGDFDGARRWLATAQEIALKLNLCLERARLLIEMGSTVYFAADVEQKPVVRAREIFYEALAIAKKSPNGALLADALRGIVNCAIALERASEATRLINELNNTVPKQVLPDIHIHIELALARIAHMTGDWQRASDAYCKIIPTRCLGVRAMAACGQGALQWHKGRHKEAQGLWRTARKSANQAGPRTVLSFEANLTRCKEKATNPPH